MEKENVIHEHPELLRESEFLLDGLNKPSTSYVRYHHHHHHHLLLATGIGVAVTTMMKLVRGVGGQCLRWLCRWWRWWSLSRWWLWQCPFFSNVATCAGVQVEAGALLDDQDLDEHADRQSS